MNNRAARPTVSVMIPYFNCKEYIAETIESVERQTYPNIETIVVDDGSDSEHAAYLKAYLSDKPFIKLETQTNRGVATARNRAARLANGKYFLFLDADDVILPEYIEKAVSILESNSDCKLVYPQAEFFGLHASSWHLPAFSGLGKLLEGNHIPIIAIHHAEDFKKLSGFDENLVTHEDWDLWIRILKHGHSAVQIPQILFRYRKRVDQSSLTDRLLEDSFVMKQSWQQVYIKHSELFVKNGLGYHDLVSNRKKCDARKNGWLKKLTGRLKK